MFDYDVNTGQVRMYGLIGDIWEDSIKETDVMQMLDAMGGRDVTIQLKSEGGAVDHGLSIYQQIKQYPGKVSVTIDTLAASAGTVIPMGADSISMMPGSLFMIHRAWTIAVGDSPELRSVADVLEKWDFEIAKIYASRSGRPAEEHMQEMNAETWFNAEEAKAAGLIDQVVGDTVETPVTIQDSTELEVVAVAAKRNLARLKALHKSIDLRSRKYRVSS